MSQLVKIQGYSATYVPVLKGATTDPGAATYSVQNGEYTVIGDRCFFNINIVTTSITKAANLTDAVRISLPLVSANPTGTPQERCVALGQNSTPVKTSTVAIVPKNAQYVEFHYDALNAVDAPWTYGLTDLGVLTNTCTFNVSGSYRVAA